MSDDYKYQLNGERKEINIKKDGVDNETNQ